MSDSSQNPALPPLLEGDVLYDLLMGEIEPELTSEGFPAALLAMQTESNDERAARAKRYDKAFQEYDKKLGEHKKNWDAAFAVYRKDNLKEMEAAVEKKEESDLQNIETALKDAA